MAHSIHLRPANEKVAIVTGGGNGIGAAVALELAQQGTKVVIVDSGASVAGEPLHEPSADAALHKVEALGGVGKASMVSVTDAEGIRSLCADVVNEFGSIDVVVHAAGTLRLPQLVDTTAEDWWNVLDVHFNGYLNVLRAALPYMIEAGYGRIVGFTSGVGLNRTIIDGSSYGCAKRAIAALTWELAEHLPSGISVNALSPIAATRMVREMLMAGGRNAQGLDLSGMLQPQDMAPAAVLLTSFAEDWCRGNVIFSAGSELSVIAPPRLIESVRTRDVADVNDVLEALIPAVFVPVESSQKTNGGSSGSQGRFKSVFNSVSTPTESLTTIDKSSFHYVLASDSYVIETALQNSFDARGYSRVGLANSKVEELRRLAPPDQVNFSAPAELLRQLRESQTVIDAIVVVYSQEGSSSSQDDQQWLKLLDEHSGTALHVLAHASWLRAAAEHAAISNHPLRIVHVTNTRGSNAHSASQATVQMVRSANDTPSTTNLNAFSVSLEADALSESASLSALVSKLITSEGSADLANAELVVGPGWLGLRNHPAPQASVCYGGPDIPDWVEDCLRQMIVPRLS